MGIKDTFFSYPNRQTLLFDAQYILTSKTNSTYSYDPSKAICYQITKLQELYFPNTLRY